MRADDKRRTCWCLHRYRDHATGGTACLAWVDDPNRTSLKPCPCHGWQPRPLRERRWYRDVLAEAGKG